MIRKAASSNNVMLLSRLLSKLNMNDHHLIDEIDSTGRSALMIAAERGYTECVELLLQYGADTSIRTLRGTALIWAANRGHAHVICLLMDYGAKANTRDLSGSTALIYACKYGNYESVSAMIESRRDPYTCCDLNIRDKWGMTALHYAAREGHYSCVMKLLEYDADLTIKDRQDKTPLNYATSDDIAELIECCEMTAYPSTNCIKSRSTVNESDTTSPTSTSTSSFTHSYTYTTHPVPSHLPYEFISGTGQSYPTLYPQEQLSILGSTAGAAFSPEKWFRAYA